MPADYADKPTSEWEYSHALAERDVIVDTETGDRLRVDTVHDDGSVTVADLTNGGFEEWTENEARAGLRDSTIETEHDGLSHELATY